MAAVASASVRMLLSLVSHALLLSRVDAAADLVPLPPGGEFASSVDARAASLGGCSSPKMIAANDGASHAGSSAPPKRLACLQSGR